jgi:hypothetical protein
LQAHTTAAQKVRNGGHRFAGVPAVRTDGEDQVSKRQVFVGLFHGWDLGKKVGKKIELRDAGANRATIGGQANPSAFQEIADGGSGFI